VSERFNGAEICIDDDNDHNNNNNNNNTVKVHNISHG
jgi:hypothetical protein